MEGGAVVATEAVVIFETAAQAQHALADVGFHSAERLTQFCGDGGVGHAAVEGQLDSLALTGFQDLQGGAHNGVHGAGDELVFGAG